MREQRVVIPTAFRLQCLENVHNQTGPTSTLSNLRNRVWFPTMGVMVQEYCDTYTQCQAGSPCNLSEPMIVTEMPPAPWHTLRTAILDDKDPRREYNNTPHSFTGKTPAEILMKLF